MINGQLSVRPVKIVAGHEPEKTNEFLQAMGIAILSKVSVLTTLLLFFITVMNCFSWPFCDHCKTISHLHPVKFTSCENSLIVRPRKTKINLLKWPFHCRKVVLMQLKRCWQEKNLEKKQGLCKTFIDMKKRR